MQPSSDHLPPDEVLAVAAHCLCLKAQRAARALARRFDAAFRPLDLTNGQFSLLMALNRPRPPTISDLAQFLAMDRTTLTAILKPLVRRSLVQVSQRAGDRRVRDVAITRDGVALLTLALPIWRATHGALDASISLPRVDRLRGDLTHLTQALDTSASYP